MISSRAASGALCELALDHAAVVAAEGALSISGAFATRRALERVALAYAAALLEERGEHAASVLVQALRLENRGTDPTQAPRGMGAGELVASMTLEETRRALEAHPAYRYGADKYRARQAIPVLREAVVDRDPGDEG